MRLVKKYDVEKRETIDYEIPKKWRIALWNTLPDERVNCAQCGRENVYNSFYTSREIMNSAGLGYGVCGDCYRIERARLICA